MGDLTFSSYTQGPLGEAIKTADTMGTLPVPTFAPAVTLAGPAAQTDTVHGPDTRLLGPGDVTGLLPGCVLRTEPADGAVDIEPNYLASVEVTPAELPWVLTPARASNGRLRPWLVLVVLVADTAPVRDGAVLPFVEADLSQLPDLRDSWGWAHIQRAAGDGRLVGGGQITASTIARLICPRHLTSGVTYRACLVPAFQTGVAAGLGTPLPAGTAHELAWAPGGNGSVRLPVYHHWTFTTGPDGDFEQLVTRLRPAEEQALRVSSVRPVDVREPWPGDTALSGTAEVVGVQGALRPFLDPPAPDPEIVAELVKRLRAELDAPAERLVSHAVPNDQTGALAPPLYGARHVAQDRVDADPAWIGQLNTSVANRIAAGLGAEYVRVHQEDLMAKAWAQVGAIREVNRRRATVELTTAVAERLHRRHVLPLQPGEILTLTAPAQARIRTSASTTLSMELRMSRLTDGIATSAFARRLRPTGKLARRSGVTVSGIMPRGLAGEVDVPADTRVIPVTPAVDSAGAPNVISTAAARQLMVMTALAEVATVNNVAGGGDLMTRVGGLGLGDQVTAMAAAGNVQSLAAAIAGQVGTVTEMTGQVLADMAHDAAFGDVTASGIPIAAGQIADRVRDVLSPGTSHWARLAAQTVLPERLAPPDPSEPVMACPAFPVPTALALLESDPEWLMPGLGALPTNRVALLRQNSAFIESYLVGINHEMMRELLWREYPTDRRGTPFTTFWPRPDGSPDINPLHTWTDAAALGDRLLQDEALAVLLIRGDVLRRYPGMVVTAVRSGLPDEQGRHRPDPAATPLTPSFVIQIDTQTNAYAFAIPEQELRTPASPQEPGWFFVFAENSFRIRFGFDAPPSDGSVPGLGSWNDAVWPVDGAPAQAVFVPVVGGHAVAGLPFGPPGDAAADTPQWNRDAADIARITLQRPFRVAIQADILLQPANGA